MNELLCLECPLAACDETDARCLLRETPDEERRKARQAYHREYDRARYARIKDAKKLTNAAYWKEYAKRTDRREYYREYRRRQKECTTKSTRPTTETPQAAGKS